MDWIGLLSGLVGIAGTLIKIWLDNRPERLEEAAHAKLQQGRTDIESGNADAVRNRLDRLLVAQDNSAAGSASAEDIQRRLSAL